LGHVVSLLKGCGSSALAVIADLSASRHSMTGAILCSASFICY